MVSANEILLDFCPMFRVFKCGRIERLLGKDFVPASVDLATGVRSKDVTINARHGVSARLYVPKSVDPDHKLPLLIYFHGGGFVVESAFSLAYHTHLNKLVAEANVIAVSVDYRRAPEHPLPIAYEDSWEAVKWAASHSSKNGQEPWLNDYADFQSVFFAGDSAGANISHNLALRVGLENPDGFNLDGIVLVHPYFWGKEAVGGEPVEPESRAFADTMWLYTCPGSNGPDDPLINPGSDPRISSLGCKKVLIFVAEQDFLKHRGVYYKELLEKSGYGGKIEIVETKNENHIFHLFNPTTDNAASLVKSFASFMNRGK
ncbi:putative carboxylesterase 12 [Heracleum sosnowskyi]|uniref:Carboxylesterase 12 n=1 Tax=Heracleum sosnowskyi TaxID=360622 RepID=A0AAD8JCS1_9APIA|nr:putative carboxylesterase 12 [Heracleum sosnowskyi]